MQINHTPKHYISYKIFKVDDILKHVGTNLNRLNIGENLSVNLRSQRLELFKAKGVCCVSCQVQGHYFSAEKSRKGNDKSYHLNLYTEDGVLMTKDHIVPKSLGGKNELSNYQTMCSTCNWKKGNTQ